MSPVLTQTPGSDKRLDEMNTKNELKELQEQFLSHVSHEFRSPLTAVKGFMDLLLRPGEKHSRRHLRYLESMRQGVTRLNRFIDNLMDITTLDSGVIEPMLEMIDLKKAIETVITAMRDEISEYRLTIKVNVSDGFCVRADRELLRKIIFQVLSNAIKFTPDGGKIIFRAKMEESRILMSISDSGVGIPSGDTELVFEKFHQAETKNKARKTTGAGLGLAIARKLVELQGGKMWVEKSSSRGTTVAWFLPRSA